jgi:hypothetical protein
MTRAMIALLAGLELAALVYPLLRTYQFFMHPEPNPALVLWSEHSGFFWRAWTSAYLGGMAAIVAGWLAGPDTARVARVVERAFPVVAVVLALQGLLIP